MMKYESESMAPARSSEMNRQHIQLRHDLQERVKELTCLYGFTRIIGRNGISLPEIYQGLVDIIPLCWQYPEIAHSRLTIKDKAYTSEGFKETGWKQSAPVRYFNNPIGVLEVFYTEKKPVLDEGPFLKEERNLINDLADRTGRIIEKFVAERKLRKVKKILSKQKQKLEQKNIALREIISQIAAEKYRTEELYNNNMRKQLIPILNEMEASGMPGHFIRRIEQCLKDITSPLYRHLEEAAVFSHREREICGFIKKGMKNKEIASQLNISVSTVNNHRTNIRKKLNITNKSMNLESYLANL